MARSQIHGSGKLVSLSSRDDNVRQMSLEARVIDDRTTLENNNNLTGITALEIGCTLPY
jgi:hypothetical protein